jgi:predicted metal-dependent hydrolase
LEQLQVDEISVEVRRNSRRRTRIGLGFDPAGHVILDAPLNASLEELHAVVVEHQRWLRRRLESVQQDAVCVAAPHYVSGELLQYLGEAYELQVKEGASSVSLRPRNTQLGLFPGLAGISGEIQVRLVNPTPATVARRLKRWYQQQASTVFAARLERFRDLPWLKQELPVWRSRFMRSQWGSCSYDGVIALNTHLIKTPEPVIDYVILHELCHLVHHDHSRRFYSLLSTHMPDWQERSNLLDGFMPVLLHE